MWMNFSGHGRECSCFSAASCQSFELHSVSGWVRPNKTKVDSFLLWAKQHTVSVFQLKNSCIVLAEIIKKIKEIA